MIDEATIITQLKDKSQREKAFSTLVHEYQEALYWQIRRLVLTHDDADDVLQNTFIKAWMENGIQRMLRRQTMRRSRRM